MTVRLTWVDNNADETGHQIYRSTSPMDPAALPAPIATLAADVTTYDDTAAPADTDCYYRVAAVRNGELAVSAESIINTGTGEVPVETDLHWNSVTLLMHMDGVHGGTSFLDAKGSTVSAFGNVVASTTNPKFGSASADFSGQGYFDIPPSAGLAFGIGDFTFEFFIKTGQSSVGALQRLVAPRATYTDPGMFQIWQNDSGAIYGTVDSLQLTKAGGTGFLIDLKDVITDNVWHHVVFTRSAGVLMGFLDGVLKASVSNSTNFNLPETDGLRIGRAYDGQGSGDYFRGYIDELRITKGVARYTADFTPPTKAFPNAGPTVVAPTPPAIGEYWTGQGGYYAGDITYADGRQFHLVVADKSADITGDESRWKTEDTTTIGSDSSNDGVLNTNAMVTAGVHLHPAANHSVNYGEGGKSDWYIPAYDELKTVRNNFDLNNTNTPSNFKSGGSQAFTSWYYWTSTQVNLTKVYVLWMGDSSETSVDKNNSTYRVRPIRRVAKTA